jgi:hypothetical protein
MNQTTGQNMAASDKISNLRATFEILSYLHVDARRDGHTELADRLEFAMNYSEQKLAELKTASPLQATPVL